MRKLLAFSTAIILALGIAGSAAAKQLKYQGTMTSKLAAGRTHQNHIVSSGVSTVNLSSGGGLLNTIHFPLGATGSDFSPVTDPDVTATLKSIRVYGTRMTGTLKDFQNLPLTSDIMGIRGIIRVCLFVTDCTAYFDIPLSVNDGHTAVGVGGVLMGNFGFGAVRVSIEAAPWTLGSGSAVNQTEGGNFKTVVVGGFIHGAASGTGGAGSTAVTSGVVQLITPMQVKTVGFGDNNELQSLFTMFRVHFIPEPGFLLLLGAGAVGLGILGRNRLLR